MKELVLFMITYIFIFIIYQLLIIYKKKNNSELLEIKYLVSIYNLNIDKINKDSLRQICAIISSFDIAVTVGIVSHLQGLVIEIIGCFITVFVLVICSYHLVYLYYKKRGLIKNGKRNKNRK